jgi:hypothetical protein
MLIITHCQGNYNRVFKACLQWLKKYFQVHFPPEKHSLNLKLATIKKLKNKSNT